MPYPVTPAKTARLQRAGRPKAEAGLAAGGAGHCVAPGVGVTFRGQGGKTADELNCTCLHHVGGEQQETLLRATFLDRFAEKHLFLGLL